MDGRQGGNPVSASALRPVVPTTAATPASRAACRWSRTTVGVGEIHHNLGGGFDESLGQIRPEITPAGTRAGQSSGVLATLIEVEGGHQSHVLLGQNGFDDLAAHPARRAPHRHFNSARQCAKTTPSTRNARAERPATPIVLSPKFLRLV